MTNTCLAEGSDDEDEIVRSVDNGCMLRASEEASEVCSFRLK